MEAFIRAKVSALKRNGIPVTEPAEAVVWLNERRKYLRHELESVAAKFEVTSAISTAEIGRVHDENLQGMDFPRFFVAYYMRLYIICA
jgi:hypothetical protein